MRFLTIFTLAVGLAAAATSVSAQGDEHHPAGGAPRAASPHPSMSSHMSAPRSTAPHARPSASTASRSSTRTSMASHHTVHHTVHRVSTTHHRTTAALHHRTSTRLRSTAAARHARVNIAKFRRTMVATRHFHAGPYRAPPGFRYRRWAIGDRLPGLYFAPSFWISDFGIYGLLAPPYGYVWVRYGPDAVLIDEYTGEVISVDFGLFF